MLPECYAIGYSSGVGALLFPCGQAEMTCDGIAGLYYIEVIYVHCFLL